MSGAIGVSGGHCSGKDKVKSDWVQKKNANFLYPDSGGPVGNDVSEICTGADGGYFGGWRRKRRTNQLGQRGNADP